MGTTRRAALAGALTLSLLACRAVTEPRPVLERRPGVISVVLVPDVGSVGEPIPIVVTTLGGGCIRQGDTEAHTAGLTADVTPYDSVFVYLPPKMACTSELKEYTHHATIAFAVRGAVVVRVHGQAQQGSAEAIVERTIRIE